MSYNILMIVNPKAGKAKISKLTPEIIRNLQKQNYKVITRYTGKDKNARNVWKKKNKVPFFESKITLLAFNIVYILLRLRLVNLALFIMSFVK